MNKILRITLMGLFAFACSTTFAQEVTLDFSTNSWNLPEGSANKKTTAGTFTNGTYSITLEAASSGYYFNTDGYLMLGKQNATLTLPSFNFDVSKIEVTGRSYASSSVVQNIYVGENAVSTATTGAQTSNTYDISENYQQAGNIYILKVTSTHNTQIVAIKIYKKTATTKKSAGLSFSETALSVAKGSEFTAPTLTKATTAAATYTSSNENVATVDANTGAVTIKDAGATTITASTEANSEYEAGSASYTITVTASEVNLPYTETFSDNQGSFTINNVSMDEGLTYVWKYNSYKYMKASAYSGANKAAESWLISPIINMQKATVASLTFDQCISKYFGTVANEATLWIKEVGGEWKQQTITYPTITSGNWSSFETQTIDLSSYAGKKINVAFKYTSSTSAAGTWEIKNFSVTATSTNINNITTNDSDENASSYNIGGQRVNSSYKGIIVKKGKKYLNK